VQVAAGVEGHVLPRATHAVPMWADRVQTQRQMQPNTSPQVCHRFRATCHACTNLAWELNPTDISRADADARARCCTSWQPAWLAGTHASRSSAPPVTRQGWRITFERVRGCGQAASALTWAATPAATPTLADVDTWQHRGRVASNERCFQVAFWTKNINPLVRTSR
jgi:hypothetical protein